MEEWQQPEGVGTNLGGLRNKEIVAGVKAKLGQVMHKVSELKTHPELPEHWLAFTNLKNAAKHRTWRYVLRHPKHHSPHKKSREDRGRCCLKAPVPSPEH